MAASLIVNASVTVTVRVDYVYLQISLLTSNINISIDTTPLVYSLFNLGYAAGYTTTRGVVNTRTRVQVSAQFSDDTIWTNLFSTVSNVAYLPGLVSFNCSTNLPTGAINAVSGPVFTTPSTCDPTFGTITLRGNSYKYSTLTAASYDGTTQSVLNYPTVLTPSPYDVGLSSPGSTLPVDGALFVVGSLFTINVVYNSGGQQVSLIDLYLSFDPTAVVAKTVGQGGALGGWQVYFGNLADDPSLVHIGGRLVTPIAGSALILSTVQFQIVKTNTLVKLTGYVKTLANYTEGDITPPDTPFMSGTFWFASGTPIGSRRRRSEATVLSGVGSAGRRNTPVLAPAVFCTGVLPCCTAGLNREQGDVNGDCVFNVKDASFAARYVASIGAPPILMNPDGSAVSAGQLQHIDQDYDGDYTNLDVIFMLSVNFDYLMFLVGPPKITMVSQPSCLTTISVQFRRKASGVVPSDAYAAIFIDLESTDFANHPGNEFDRSAVPPMSGVIIPKPTLACKGGYYRTVHQGSGIYTVQVFTEYATQQIGMSFVQATLLGDGSSIPARTWGFFGTQVGPQLFNKCKLLTTSTTYNITGMNGVDKSGAGYNPVFVYGGNSSLGFFTNETSLVGCPGTVATSITTIQTPPPSPAAPTPAPTPAPPGPAAPTPAPTPAPPGPAAPTPAPTPAPPGPAAPTPAPTPATLPLPNSCIYAGVYNPATCNAWCEGCSYVTPNGATSFCCNCCNNAFCCSNLV